MVVRRTVVVKRLSPGVDGSSSSRIGQAGSYAPCVSVSVGADKVRVVVYAFRQACTGVNPEKVQPDTTQSSVHKVGIDVYVVLCAAYSLQTQCSV